MPLWMSGCQGLAVRQSMGSDDDGAQLSGGVAFEAADGFVSHLAFGDASLDVAATACLPAESGKADRVESRVGLRSC
jgi:hypothetical protein